jgi:hypothetical protein
MLKSQNQKKKGTGEKLLLFPFCRIDLGDFV